MKASYVSHSIFLQECEQAIKTNLIALKNGRLVQFNLKPGGYAGRVTATISDQDAKSFVTEDTIDRFPVRIRVVATALYKCSCFGVFDISHVDGNITVRHIK